MHVPQASQQRLLQFKVARDRLARLSCDSHTEEHDDIVLRASDSPRVVGVVVWAQCDMLEWAV